MATEVTAQTRVERAPGLLAEEVLGETVVLDIAADRYVRLNRSAGLLWHDLEEPTTVAALAAVLLARFELPETRALEDAAALVRGLADRGLVTLS